MAYQAAFGYVPAYAPTYAPYCRHMLHSAGRSPYGQYSYMKLIGICVCIYIYIYIYEGLTARLPFSLGPESPTSHPSLDERNLHLVRGGYALG